MRRLLNWLFHWRTIRRCAYVLAALVILFYVEEDWRGKHDWDQYKRTWEAKGERFDFASFVPPAVPDDQNFALTPIVASTYSAVLDRHGHHLDPPDTNIVNRMEFFLGVPPALKPWPTNDFEGNWQYGVKADLSVLQTYYRAPINTNLPEGYYPPWPLALTNDFPTAPQPQSPEADVLLALSKYDAVIEELRQASRLPYSRFPLNYNDRPIDEKVVFPHRGPMQECARVLRMRAIAELDSGQSDRALENLKLILYLAKACRMEPLMVSRSNVRIVNAALQPVWEGLHDCKWSDAQLAVIDHELARFDFLSEYQFAVRCSRARVIDAIDYMERQRGYHQIRRALFAGPVEEGSLKSAEESPFFATILSLIPTGWFYENELAVALTHQQALPPSNGVGGKIFPREIEERTVRLVETSNKHRSPCNLFAPVREFGSLIWFAFAQSSVDNARVACALERYHLAHGEYPASLDLLSPQFIDKLPPDLINGQPLCYRRTDQGKFLLYSVGWNGKDDGGIVPQEPGLSGLSRLLKGDWVWPSSAAVFPKVEHRVFPKVEHRGLRRTQSTR